LTALLGFTAFWCPPRNSGHDLPSINAYFANLSHECFDGYASHIKAKPLLLFHQQHHSFCHQVFKGGAPSSAVWCAGTMSSDVFQRGDVRDCDVAPVLVALCTFDLVATASCLSKSAHVDLVAGVEMP
jgi:hypothetical protein